MKISWMEITINLIFVIGIILGIIFFGNWITENARAFFIVLFLFFVNYIIILFHEKKYQQNFPYKPYKSRKKIWERILIGLLAGLHYLFFIGSYDHKKYNTQAYYPETLECFFGNISQFIILIFYIIIGVNIFKSIGYYSLILMGIPIVTNITSIIVNRGTNAKKD